MNDEPTCNDEAKAGQTLARPACSEIGYKSVTLLASEHPNLAEYLGQLERERDDMLAFIREQVELWDNDGDSGFPLYEHGKRILAGYPPPEEQADLEKTRAEIQRLKKQMRGEGK